MTGGGSCPRRRKGWESVAGEFNERWPINRSARKTQCECIVELRGMHLVDGGLFERDRWDQQEVYVKR